MINNIPEGYMLNHHGDLVSIKNIREIDLEKDTLVKELIKSAKELRQEIEAKKQRYFEDFKAFVELSTEKYDVKFGGVKGNTTLESFDGKYKVEFSISERIKFDEKINAAKALIDECIQDWTRDSAPEVATLVQQAFKVNKQGELNTRRILELRRIEIEDERWQRAMQAISDSFQVSDTKEYMRFYERDDEGKYQHISLDFAQV